LPIFPKLMSGDGVGYHGSSNVRDALDAAAARGAHRI
jgi:hypothetical protein